MNKILPLLIYAALFFIVLLTAGMLFVQTTVFKGWLAERIAGAVEGGMAGDVRIGRLGGTLFTGVTLSGVSIGAGSDRVITADEVRVNYFFPAMALHRIDVTALTVVRPRLTFRQKGDGAWNYSRVFVSKGTTPARKKTRSPLEGWSLRARKIELIGGSAFVIDNRGKTVAWSPDLSMSSEAKLRYTSKGVEGAVGLEALRIESAVPAALRVVLSGGIEFGDGALRFDLLDLAAGDSRGRITGTVSTAGALAIDGHADFPVISFDDVRKFVPGVSLSSAAALSVDFHGTPSVFKAKTALSYEAARADLFFDVNGDPFATGSGTCTIRVFPSRAGRISSGGGEIVVAASNGRVELRTDDFTTSLGTFTVRGSAAIRGLVDRKIPVIGNLAVNAGDIAAAADFSVYGGTVSVSSLTVVSDGLRLVSSGTFAGGKMDFSYSTGITEMGVIGRYAPGLGLEGSMASTGSVTGTTARPVFSGRMSGENLRVKEFSARKFYLEANGVSGGANDARIPGELRLSAEEIIAGGAPFMSLKLYAAGRGTYTVVNADIKKDDDRKARLGGALSFPGEGSARLLVNAFEIVSGTVTWSVARPVEAVLSPGGGALGDFELAHANQRLKLSGAWENGGSVRLDAAAAGIDLNTVAYTAGMSLPLAGILNSTFTVRGRSSRPEMNGTLFVSTGTLGGFPFERIASTAVYDGGTTRLLLTITSGGREVLVASGTVPAAASERMNVHLSARDLDLSVLSALAPGIEEASGQVTAFLTVGGTIAAPEIKGDVTLPGGTLGIRGTGVAYRDVRLHLRVANDTLYIDRLTLKSGQGNASASGSFRLKGFMPVSGSLDATARRFKALDTRVFSGILDADIRLRPRGDGSLLSGRVSVVEGQVTIPRASPVPEGEITVIETGAGGEKRVVKEPGRSPVPFVRDLAMRVDVGVPGNTWVRGEGLNAEAKGKLLVARNPGERVAVSGELSAVRGTFQFRGKILTIDRARLAFTGEPRINPIVNAEGSTTIEDITVYVTLRGTLNSPQISLRSVPPHDESDLIAYLVFGRPLGKLSESENRLVQRAAVQALGGIAATGVKDFLGESFAPDVIDVYSGQEKGISVGKYITNRLFVRYEWRFGLEEIRRTVINVQLNEHFALSSQVGNERTSGVDILWTTNY